MVQGLRSLNRRLTRTIPDGVRRAAAQALEENAREIVAEMQRMVPVESGALRDSIGWTWGDAPSGAISLGKAKAGRLSITIYAGGGEAFYAWFQEFGTVNMPANPFFFPSYRKLRRKAKGRVTRKINKAIRSS